MFITSITSNHVTFGTLMRLVSLLSKPQKESLSRRGRKQVSFLVSAERGTPVTVADTVSASGNPVPPFFVFPHILFKDFLLEQAPPSSGGTSIRSGWMQEDSFPLYLKHFAVHARCTKDRPTLLLLDNHMSHLSI
ncbi:tigger transposable element-derived protein [Plakobranchus ocellatus]|uniref:Tigger transposable element-derived protein n=1 Tax=Plakobranchus ocellatus TaxID=259542 RepID=A0AAV4CF21_9GAST|nr:tigger transposable element-derived protein [Plakobranchus ocellatus]